MLNALRQRLPRNVWILGFVSLFADINSKMVQSVLPLFLVSSLGANLLTVGLIEGIAESTASIVKIGSGALSDYWQRRKKLAIAGYGLSTLVTAVFAVATSPGWVLLGRFLDRFGKGIRVAPRNALVADTTPPEKRGAAFGLRQTLDTIGAFLGPLLATALLLNTQQNFRLVFWLALLPGLIAVLLLIFGVQESAHAKATPQNPLQWQRLKKLDRRYWLLLVVAFELVRRLRQDDRSPLHLFVSGCRAPHLPDPEPLTHTLPDAEFLDELHRSNGTPQEVLADCELMALLLPMLRADFTLSKPTATQLNHRFLAPLRSSADCKTKPLLPIS